MHLAVEPDVDGLEGGVGVGGGEPEAVAEDAKGVHRLGLLPVDALAGETGDGGSLGLGGVVDADDGLRFPAGVVGRESEQDGRAAHGGSPRLASRGRFPTGEGGRSFCNIDAGEAFYV
jgi:hypothetical protein